MLVNPIKKRIIVGVDEVGRGPLAGPVLSAAVILGNNVNINLLADSKSIAKTKIPIIAEKIQQTCIWSIGTATVEEIEELNILQSTLLSMRRAINGLNVKYDIVLIDGNQNPLPLESNIKMVIGGDKKEPSISASSILAKAIRDNMMAGLHLNHPQYNWIKNSGYGTLEHREAIKQHGITPHHRKYFLKKIL